MVFTEQQLQVKKLVDVQQDIEIDALNDGVGALSSTMQNGFTEAANNFSDIQNSLESMNTLSNERYNGLTGSINTLSNAMTQGFLDMGNTVVNTTETIQGQFNDVNNYVGGFENNVNTAFDGVQNQFNLVNANISDSINNFNEQITNSLSVKELSVDTMVYNISATPVSSLTALGYDSNGKVIPVTVIANQNVVLPENANYLYTDVTGTPYAGMADTVVSTNENLITSHAVYNAVNDIWADLNAFHNDVSNSFGDVQNNFNAVDSTFAGVQNQFNDVNNNFAGVQNQFNDVNNSIVDMNNSIQNQFSDVNNSINTMNSGLQSKFNDVTNSIEDSNTIISMLLRFHSSEIIELYPTTYYNSNMVGYHNLTEIVFAKNTDVVGTSYGNTVLNFNTQTNILTIGTPFGLPSTGFSKDMSYTFNGCNSLNQNIQIPEGVTNLTGTFGWCSNLNQNIKIPNTVTILGFSQLSQGAFHLCTNLNQNIVIPENVRRMNKCFWQCGNLNQDIYIYSDKIEVSAGGISKAFEGCNLLASRNIYIRRTIPKETSNAIYNALVNNSTGINWNGRIYNIL